MVFFVRIKLKIEIISNFIGILNRGPLQVANKFFDLLGFLEFFNPVFLFIFHNHNLKFLRRIHPEGTNSPIVYS